MLRPSRFSHLAGHDVFAVDGLFEQQGSVALIVRRDVRICVVHASAMHGVPVDYSDWCAIKCYEFQLDEVFVRVVRVPLIQ